MPSKPQIIAITSPESPELSVLKELEGVADVVAVGQNIEALGLADDAWPTIDVMLNCGATAPLRGRLAENRACVPGLPGAYLRMHRLLFAVVSPALKS